MEKETHLETQARLSELIKKKSQHEQQKNVQQKEKEETYRLSLLKKVEELYPRIKLLIDLANQCSEEGISFPTSSETKSFGYGNGLASFLADAFYHRVGFICLSNNGLISNNIPFFSNNNSSKRKIISVGILNGGACGPYDLHVDEASAVMRQSNTPYYTQLPDARNLEQFLRDFPNFEQAFHRWIESFAEDIHECEDTQPPLPTI